MAITDFIRLAIIIDMAGDALSQLAGFEGKIAKIGKGLGALADLEVFTKTKEGLESVINAGADQETMLARLGTSTDLAAAKLAVIGDRADAFTAAQAGATGSQYLVYFGKLYSSLHNVAAAELATENAIKASHVAGISNNATIDLMTTLYEQLGTSSTDVANALAGTSKIFGIDADQAESFARAAASTAEAARRTHTPVAQMFAILGEGYKLAPAGGKGLTAMASVLRNLPETMKDIVPEGTSMIDMLTVIGNSIKDISSDAAKGDILRSKFGFTGTEAEVITKYVNQLSKIGPAAEAIQKGGAGALADGIKLLGGTYADSLTKFSAAWEALRESVGTPLLGALSKLLTATNRIVMLFKGWADMAPTFTGVIVFAGAGLVGLATSVGLLGVAISTVASMIKAFKEGWAGIKWVAMKAEVIATTLYTWAATAATYAWTAAQWALNVAMDANPIGLVILGIAALVGAALLIYKYWGPIKNFFVGLWDAISSIAWSSLGTNIIKFIAGGMLDALGLGALRSALSYVGKLISDHFPHSQPRVGPLRDLVKVPITDVIAKSLAPGPVVASMRKVALAAAIAATPVYGLAGVAAAGGGAAGGSRGGGVSITYAPVINVGPGTSVDEFARELEKHGDKVLQIVERANNRRMREEF